MESSDDKSANGPAEVFGNWLLRFGKVAEQCDAEGMGQLFAPDSFWKDILSFTWEHRTFFGPGEVRDAFDESARRVQPRNVRIAEGRSAPRLVRRMGNSVVEGYFQFDTAIGHGVGFVRLLHDAADPLNSRVWTLLTTLHEIRGFEE